MQPDKNTGKWASTQAPGWIYPLHLTAQTVKAAFFSVLALKCTIALQHDIEARVNLTKAGMRTGCRERNPLLPSLPQSQLVHSRLPAPGGQRFMRVPSSTRRCFLSSRLRFASFRRTNKFRPELRLMDAGVVEVSENLKKGNKGWNKMDFVITQKVSHKFNSSSSSVS